MREAALLVPYQLPVATGLWLALVVICVLLAVVLAVVLIARSQKRGMEKRVGLEIVNQGNVATAYELRAEPGAGPAPQAAFAPQVAFAFSYQGQVLAARSYEELAPVAPPAGPRAQQDASRGAPGRPAGPSIGRAAERGLGVLGGLAMLLSTVGALLPLSMRNPVLRAAAQLRMTASSGRRALSVPGQIGAIKEDAAGGAGQGYQAAGAGYQAAPAGYPPSATVERAWAETPLVQPGQGLSLDMTLRPLSLAGGACPFTVLSRPAGQLDAPPVTGQGFVQIAARSWLRRYGPYLLVLLAAAAVLAFTFYAVR